MFAIYVLIIVDYGIGGSALTQLSRVEQGCHLSLYQVTRRKSIMSCRLSCISCRQSILTILLLQGSSLCLINTLLLTLPPWAFPQAAGKTNHSGALKAKVIASTSHLLYKKNVNTKFTHQRFFLQHSATEEHTPYTPKHSGKKRHLLIRTTNCHNKCPILRRQRR